MVLSSFVAPIRTVARLGVAVLFAFVLSPVPARAIPMPDSAGFARWASLVGPSVHARLRVRWHGEWVELRGVSYDSRGPWRQSRRCNGRYPFRVVAG